MHMDGLIRTLTTHPKALYPLVVLSFDLGPTLASNPSIQSPDYNRGLEWSLGDTVGCSNVVY